MKRLLTLSAATLALTAAGGAAHATAAADVTSATTVKTTTTKTTTTNVFPAGIAFPATAHEYLLKDGTFLVVDGTTAWTVTTSEAGKVAAEDGDHILADDKVITTKHGYVVGGVPELGIAVPGAVATDVVKVRAPVTTTSVTTTAPVTSESSTTTTSTTTTP